ncbi:hypothetical protein RRG08_018061 [Elysia crispata]|uniref:Uncharacterized protein n=1 Tax=Elysia crispata TaxID=231223 RepID=A0AAE1DE39_9GAST|nr:hypothetical protein RRG08_018061 [Elysia crispata]
MLLTATILTVFAISYLSYLFGRPIVNEDKDTEKGEEENKEAEVISKQNQGQINEIGTQTNKSNKEIVKDTSKQQSLLTQEIPVPPDGEQTPLASAGDTQQEKSPCGEYGTRSQIKVDEICKSVTVVGQKSSTSAQKLKTDGKKGQDTPSIIFQRPTRETSPMRAKPKKADPCDKSRCPSSSPISGRNFSYGYTFANQPACDPFCPRLY